MDIKYLLFSFKGRISRQPFWICTIHLALIILLPALFLFDDLSSEEADDFVFIMCLVLLWPSLAVQVKRWHDRDKSGWWVLMNFIPIIGSIWVLVDTGLLPGTEGKNSFGEDPLRSDKISNTASESE